MNFLKIIFFYQINFCDSFQFNDELWRNLILLFWRNHQSSLSKRINNYYQELQGTVKRAGRQQHRPSCSSASPTKLVFKTTGALSKVCAHTKCPDSSKCLNRRVNLRFHTRSTVTYSCEDVVDMKGPGSLTRKYLMTPWKLCYPANHTYQDS